MSKRILSEKEKKFIENCKRWNVHFEAIFEILFIISVLIPLIFCEKMRSIDLLKAFADASLYSSAILVGLLITFINQRWLRLINKLMPPAEH